MVAFQAVLSSKEVQSSEEVQQLREKQRRAS